MSERNDRSPQFVGSADATREAPRSAEFTLTPEQKQVVEVMQQGGEKLENTILDAREAAGKKLQGLHGKELVDAGLKQMGHGAWETFKSQLKWGIGGGIAGAVGGAMAGRFTGGRFQEMAQKSSVTGPILDAADYDGLFKADLGAEDDMASFFTWGGAAVGGGLGVPLGVVVGWETAGLKYNKKVAPKKDLPPAKWYDWVISNAGIYGANQVLRGRNLGNVGGMMWNAFVELFNPISVGGIRNVAKGLWEMRKGVSNVSA